MGGGAGRTRRGGGDASGRERRRGKDWAPPVGRRDGRGRRRHGRNQPPIATLDSHLAQLGFAQQHVLRLRLALHPVADIRLVVHRGAAGARPGARYSDAESGSRCNPNLGFSSSSSWSRDPVKTCAFPRAKGERRGAVPRGPSMFTKQKKTSYRLVAPPRRVSLLSNVVVTHLRLPPTNARTGSSSCVGSS